MHTTVHRFRTERLSLDDLTYPSIAPLDEEEIGFTVGEKVVHRIDVRRHELTTYVRGRAVRTMPVSAGKPGFITRSGTKVVMEKHRTKTMDVATTGIGPGDPDYYRIEDVAGDELRGVRPRRAVVGGVPRVGERQPRLCGAEHPGRALAPRAHATR
ncbi:MAG: L,D-transpeptidase [Nocardioides sp.]|nr:L,D-transpeptidase [Nocardioides sp.]